VRHEKGRDRRSAANLGEVLGAFDKTFFVQRRGGGAIAILELHIPQQNLLETEAQLR
jgi:hypothetical protein